MAKGNPNLQKARESRVAKGPEAFFFKVDDRIRVTKDNYNIIVAEVLTTQDTGKRYQINKGFYSTVNYVCDILGKEYSVSEDNVTSFRNRISGITSSYINSKLKVEVPKGVIFDEHDDLSDPENSTTEKDSEPDDTESTPN